MKPLNLDPLQGMQDFGFWVSSSLVETVIFLNEYVCARVIFICMHVIIFQ